MSELLQVLGLSLAVAVGATLLAAPVAVVVGTWLARGQGGGRFVVQSIAMAPLVLPPVVTGYLLLVVLGPRGPLGGLSPAFTTAASTYLAMKPGAPDAR